MAIENLWDVIIVGGGPAGLSAAMVLTRSRRSVLLIDEGMQRNLKSHGLHNFITRDGILPTDFLETAHRQLEKYPIVFKRGKVTSITRIGTDFFVTTDDKNKFKAKKILLATGVADIIPDIPGMKELWGCAVFQCPFCDGYESKEKSIGLYAKKYNGYGMALSLRHLSKKITLFTDGAYYLKKIQREHLKSLDIDIFTKRISKLNYEKQQLLSVVLNNGEEVPVDFMYTHHGIHCDSSFLKQLNCKCTKKGVAITNRHQQTNVPGVYVAGDASIDMHYVIVASSEGVKAGVSIHNDLLKEDNERSLPSHK